MGEYNEQIGGFVFDYASHEVTLDKSDFPAGEYVIYAVYGGCADFKHYYAPAVSNKITIKVNADVSFSDIVNGIIEALKNIETPA